MAVKVINQVIETLPPKEIKGLVDEFKKELVSGSSYYYKYFRKEGINSYRCY